MRPTDDSHRRLELLAGALRLAMSVLGAARVPPAAGMTPRDVRSNASGLSYAILASRWQRRMRQPAWPDLYAEWQRRLPPPPAIDGALYGLFDPADRFELLLDNAAAFRARYRLFESARRSIDISTYYIQADQTGRETARRLSESAARGVGIRVLADGVITARKTYENPEVATLIAGLRAAGVDFRLFGDRLRPFDASHRKLLIVDGETLIAGGRNYADHYSGTEWRDVDLLLTGPSVREARRLFERTFAESTGYSSKPPDGQPGIFQTTTPAAVAANASFLFLLECVRACRHALDIENAYYINHPILYGYLAEARKRGVRVRILTNSAQSNDLDFTNYRIYSGFPELLDAGIEVYVRPGKARTLHCKYFVADGQWVGFGSSNLDYYSPRFCGEAGIHVRSAELAGALESWFEEGLRDSERVASRSSIDAVLRKQRIGRIFDSRFTDIQ